MNKRLFGGLAAVLAIAILAAAVSLYAVRPTRASDHQDSPVTLGRPGADITDPYIFPSPTNKNNVVVVMNVHPLIPAGASAYFSHGVVYQMNFDTSSENTKTPSPTITRDLVVQFTVNNDSAGQRVQVYGPGPAPSTGNTTQLIQKTGDGPINQPFTAGKMKVFAGEREESFFFDLSRFYMILPNRDKGRMARSCLPNNLGGKDTCPEGFRPPGQAQDFFTNYNVLSIVAEMPRSMLANGHGGKIAYWSTTNTQSGH